MEPGKMEKAGASRKKGNVFRLGTFLLSLKFSYERVGFVHDGTPKSGGYLLIISIIDLLH